MGKVTPLFTILLLSAVLPLLAQPQQQSLGDVARQLRAQRDKNTQKATKVFTNDNLPASTPGETINYQPPPATTATAAATQDASEKHPPKPSEDKPQTRDAWQEKFKKARQNLAHAKDVQQVAEDELALLQIQQVREMDPNVKADLLGKVQAKQTEVDASKSATSAAQKDLDDLEKTFKDSGAPEEWSQTE